jgi:hypothetical protein
VCCSGTAFFTVGLGKSTQFNFTQLTKAVTTGSVTLTATEASNVIQKYTGTLSGNVTVTIPQVIQVYYITNQTDGTGAQATTFRLRRESVRRGKLPRCLRVNKSFCFATR